jgi:hypothetical protein
MERVRGEGEAHIMPDHQGCAQTTRLASAEWAHAARRGGELNQAQVVRRVLKHQRQKTSSKPGFLFGREKKQNALEAWAEGQGRSVGRPAAG